MLNNSQKNLARFLRNVLAFGGKGDIPHHLFGKLGKVVLVGFGTFETRKRAARNGRNPATKEVIKIPASKAPAFKAGKGLKDKVNKVSKNRK